MHDHTAKSLRDAPRAPPVLPLTRPVVAVALGALVAGGSALFLAGLATGLGFGDSLLLAARTAPAPGVAPVAASGSAIAAEPAQRLAVGDLTPLAPPPLPALPTPQPPLLATAVVAALPPTLTPAAPVPAVPPRKPAPVAVAAETMSEGPGGPEGTAVTGYVVARPSPADSASPLDSLENVGTTQRFALQTGAYSVPANADRQADELRKMGYDPYKTGHVTSRGTELTIVYAGRYDSRKTAESAAGALHRAGIDARLTALAD